MTLSRGYSNTDFVASDVSSNIRHPEQRGTSVIQDLLTTCFEVRKLSPFPSEL
ncbi:hypothetical protein [Vibrio antiquarius]|uniref:hypothetical protein n=1 Tax=Vibrio antiquarius (strain Ex25) TaxID=150340 RepID=UPI00265A4B1E|nr:hypothetical protein [Vibrio antiquarius]MCS0023225.1 hypothetical protein [Vibrio antiquarius]